MNPGDRYPKPTKVERTAAVLRENAVLVAFIAGELIGGIIIWLCVMLAHAVASCV